MYLRSFYDTYHSSARSSAHQHPISIEQDRHAHLGKLLLQGQRAIAFFMRQPALTPSDHGVSPSTITTASATKWREQIRAIGSIESGKPVKAAFTDRSAPAGPTRIPSSPMDKAAPQSRSAPRMALSAWVESVSRPFTSIGPAIAPATSRKAPPLQSPSTVYSWCGFSLRRSPEEDPPPEGK